MDIVKFENVNHSYVFSEKRIHSLNDICFNIAKGDFVAIVGKNGCGKSTLAKHINTLIELQEGVLYVNGLDAGDAKNVFGIRKSCAMVFQNPDNQFVSSVVKEDIEFGLKNFQLECNKDVVLNALSNVDMQGYEEADVNELSGGQKQRVALAGVLAIAPEIIILDEATTMLEQKSRNELLKTVKKLNEEHGTTVIMITQYAQEAAIADKVAVMLNGKIFAYDTPKNIFLNNELLQKAGLEQPFTVKLYCDLKNRGIDIGECPLNNERLVELLCRLK